MQLATFYPRTIVRGFQFGVLPVVLALAVFLVGAPAQTSEAAQPHQAEADAALGYMKSFQNPDGGFPAFGTDSSPSATVDAIFALVANTEDPAGVTNSGNSPIDYLETVASGVLTDPGAAAKLAFGLSAANVDPSDFAGLDLFDVMEGFYVPATGSYGDDAWDEAYYILALSSAGEPLPAEVVPNLQSLQMTDGGWEFSSGFGTDTNSTALMIEALVAAGVPASDSSVQDGLGYLNDSQNSDGGWPYASPGDSDPSSTGFVIQGLLAAGEDIDAGGPWAQGSATPLDQLISTQNSSTGAFQYFGEDSLYSTYQAIPAILLAPFSDLPTPVPATPTPVATPTAAPTATASSAPSATPKVTPVTLPVAGGPAGERTDLTAPVVLAALAMTTSAAAAMWLGRQKR